MKSETKQKIICGGGLLALAALFIKWYFDTRPSIAGLLAALLSACLFAALCLRFVPVWLRSWEFGESAIPKPEMEKHELRHIFLLALLWDAIIIVSVTLLRAILAEDYPLNIWRSLDSQHYLAIAEDWYLSEGSLDRLVELVFLPLYPIAVRLMNFVTGDYLIAGLCVSALCFAGAVCVFYKLLRLDFTAEKAKRAVLLLCICPGVFFFAAPMSESLFLLLSLCCIYLARRGKFLPACIFGALSAFTRSVGLALIVPVLFELIAQRKKPRDYFFLLIIPMGFAVYCAINYAVSGDDFKFMEYQSEHWNQRFGLFFSTAAYQTEYALRADTQSLLGLWLPNLIAQLSALIIMCAGVKKLRASYSAYFIAYFFVSIGATWLLSAPRYMLVMFPLFIVSAEYRRADWFIYALCLLSGLCYALLFTLRWQVW